MINKKLVAFLMLAIAVFPVAGQDLVAVYELALENDPVLREARNNRDSARESKPQALARLLPTVDFSAEANSNRVQRSGHGSTGSSGRETYSDDQFGLALSQPVYRRDFWVQFRQADNTIGQAEAEYAAAELDLIVRTAQAYFNVLAAQDNLRFRKADREATGRQLDQAQQRFDVGLIAITDVHEAQAAFDGARANEIEAENGVDNAWEALRLIVGDIKGPLSTLKKEMPLRAPEPQDIVEWADMARSQNYSIVAAENAAEVARQEIEVKRSGHYPTLDLVASHTESDTSSDTGIDRDTSKIGLQFVFPLYAGGGVVSRTDQARYDFQAAQDVLDQTRRRVNQQVRDSYRGVLSTISRAQALKAQTISAQSALESTEAGLEVGTRTIIDVLTVQQNLFRSQSEHSRSRYDYIINGLLLRQAASILSRQDLEKINVWLE